MASDAEDSVRSLHTSPAQSREELGGPVFHSKGYLIDGRYVVDEAVQGSQDDQLYFCLDRQTGGRVVVRRLSVQVEESSAGSLTSRSRLIAALRPPGVVQVLRDGRDKDGPYLVREDVSGVNNQSLGEGQRAQSVDEVAGWALQVLLALERMHAAGFVHHGVHPSNLVCLRNGTVLLVDIGVPPNAELRRKYQHALNADIVPFLPPEYKEGNQEVDWRGDLYGLGITLYVLLTGENPRVIFRDSKIPAELREFTLKLADPQPSARFSSAREARDELIATLRHARADSVKPVTVRCASNHANQAELDLCASCDALLPEHCLDCGSDVDARHSICLHCWDDLAAQYSFDAIRQAARAAEQLRDWPEALKQWELAVSQRPSARQAREAMSRVKDRQAELLVRTKASERARAAADLPALREAFQALKALLLEKDKRLLDLSATISSLEAQENRQRLEFSTRKQAAELAEAKRDWRSAITNWTEAARIDAKSDASKRLELARREEARTAKLLSEVQEACRLGDLSRAELLARDLEKVASQEDDRVVSVRGTLLPKLRERLEERDRNQKALIQSAHAKEDERDWQGALADWKRLLTLVPEATDCRDRIAQIEGLIGQLDKLVQRASKQHAVINLVGVRVTYAELQAWLPASSDQLRHVRENLLLPLHARHVQAQSYLRKAEEALRAREYESVENLLAQFDDAWPRVEGDFDFAVERRAIELRLREEQQSWDRLAKAAQGQLSDGDDFQASRTIGRLAKLRPAHLLVAELQAKLHRVREQKQRQQRLQRRVLLAGAVLAFLSWTVVGVVLPCLDLSAMHAGQSRALFAVTRKLQSAELMAAGEELKVVAPIVRPEMRTETLEGSLPTWLPARSVARHVCGNLISDPQHSVDIVELERSRSESLKRLATLLSDVRRALQQREVPQAKGLAEEAVRVCKDCDDATQTLKDVRSIAETYELRAQLEDRIQGEVNAKDLLASDDLVRQWRRAGSATNEWAPPEAFAAEVAWMATDSERVAKVVELRARLDELADQLLSALSKCDISSSERYLGEYRALQKNGRQSDFEQELERRRTDDKALATRISQIEGLLAQKQYTEALGALGEGGWRNHYRYDQLRSAAEEALDKVKRLAQSHGESVQRREVRDSRAVLNELLQFAPAESLTQDCIKSQEAFERSREELVKLELVGLWDGDILTDAGLLSRAKRLQGLLADSQDRLSTYGGPSLEPAEFMKELGRLLRIQAFAQEGKLQDAESLAVNELSADKYFDPIREALLTRRNKCIRLETDWLVAIKKGKRTELKRASELLAELRELDVALVERRRLDSWQTRAQDVMDQLESGSLASALEGLNADSPEEWTKTGWDSAYRSVANRQDTEAKELAAKIRNRKHKLDNLSLNDLDSQFKELRSKNNALAAQLEGQGLYNELRVAIDSEAKRKADRLRDQEKQRLQLSDEARKTCAALRIPLESYSVRFLVIVDSIVKEQEQAITALEAAWLAAIQNDDQKAQDAQKKAARLLRLRMDSVATEWPRLDVLHGLVESARLSSTIRFPESVTSAANGMNVPLADEIRAQAKNASVGMPRSADSQREGMQGVTARLRKSLRSYIEGAKRAEDRPNVARALTQLGALGEDKENIQELRGDALEVVGHWPVAVAAGGRHSLGLWTNGSVKGSGNNGFGQGRSYKALKKKGDKKDEESDSGFENQSGLGSIAITIGKMLAGVVVNGVSAIFSGDWLPTRESSAIRLAAGDSHSAVVLDDGEVKLWGNNNWQKATIDRAQDVSSVALGRQSTIVLYKDGFVRSYGELANSTPNKVTKAEANVVAIAAGGDFALALLASGEVVTWGGYSNISTIPLIPDGKRCVQLAAGASHAAMLLSDGSILSWGDNTHQQLNVAAPARGTRYTQIAAGGNCTLALSSDGRLFAWGEGQYGQTRLPSIPAGDSVVAVSVGGQHCLALLASGEYLGWGSNQDGQCERLE